MTIYSDDAVEPVGAAEAEATVASGVRPGRRWPAEILALGSVLPAVAAACWVLVALPLLVLHVYRPLPQLLLAVVVTGVLARPAWRVARARARTFGPVPWWVLIGVLAVVVGFGVLAFATSSGDVLVRRDPGSYAMSATWLSSHGTIQMPDHAAAFGGNDPDLLLASQGFYLQGSHVIPQFMTGVPVLLSIAGWIGGVSAVLHGNAFIGMLALLAFAGLVARLVGPRWAPIATFGLALVQPQLDVMRAAYSEPAAQLILLGGLIVVLDALAAARLRPMLATAANEPALLPATDCRRALVVGGFVMGLVSVVRIDAVADLLPLVPFIGWLAFHRQREWRVLALGVVLGMLAGAFDCVVLTLPYAKHVGSDLAMAGAGFGLGIPAAIVAIRVAWWRQRRGVRMTSRRWPTVAAAVVFLGGMFFFLRPHLMTMRSQPTSGGAYYVQQVQAILHLPDDPTRSYYEDATRWLSWYLGWATLAIALAAACWLAYEVTAGRRREWLIALLVFLGTAAAVLLRPSITPDHPWADRRFVPVVLPGAVLLAFAGVAALVRRMDTPRMQQAIVWSGQIIAVTVGAVAILLPTWAGSRHVFTTQTERGEVALVHQVCDALQPKDVVIAVGSRAVTEWPGTMGIMCGTPVGYLAGQDDAAALQRIAQRVHARGGQVMILVSSAGDRSQVPATVDWPPVPIATLETNEVGHTLIKRPDAPWALPFDMWLGRLVT